MGWGRRMIGIFVTFNFVCFCWIFFRAKDMTTGVEMIRRIFTDFNAALIPQVLSGYAAVLSFVLCGFLLHMTPARWEDAGQKLATSAPLAVQAVMTAAMIWGIMQIKSADIQPFIYFQF